MSEVIQIEHCEDVLPTSRYKYGKWDFNKFNPIQSRLLETFKGDANIAIAAATSAGKAQPDDSLILTPTGYTMLKNISVGNGVIGSDGRMAVVDGVFPQGEKFVYRIRFDDDTETLCCGEHLWSIRTRSQKKRGVGYSVLCTTEIMNSFSPKKFHIPFVEPVRFLSSSDPLTQKGLHPYLLGVLLGDGGIKYGTKISNEDDGVLRLVDKLLPDLCCLVQDKGCDYRISATSVPYNPVARELDLMGLLGKGAEDKFIPYGYLFSSIKCRWEIMRGLMDSDGGGYSNRSPTFEVTSKDLVEGMAHLVRSLGGWTRIREKRESKYTYKGQVLYGKQVYRMTVILPFNPFGVSKKASLWAPRVRDKLRSIVSIEAAGEKSCRCIKVGNSNGLYVTNDCIVTHNTVCAEMYMAYEARKRGGKSIYVGPLKALAKQMEGDWTDDDHHFSNLNISIVTGDFRLTKQRIDELDNADVVVMTPEMLASRCRNHKSDKSSFLKDVGTVVFDECFSEDTLVLTKKGPLFIGEIIDNQIDVEVLSLGPSGELSYNKIVGFQKKLLKKEWLTVYYNDGEIQVTEDQLIWANEEYKSARDLSIGDLVEVVSASKKQDKTNRERRECDLWDDVGGRSSWIDGAEQNRSKDEMQSIFGTSPISRVEIQRIEKNGSHPSSDFTQRRLRRFRQAIHDSLILRTKEDSSQSVSLRQEAGECRLVEYDNASDSFGCLVHGRWQPGEESFVNSFGGILLQREHTTERMASGEVGCECDIDSLSELLSDRFYSRGKRQVSGVDTQVCDFRDEVQITSSKQRCDLRFLWRVIQAHEKKQIDVEEVSVLWKKELLSCTEETLLCFKKESVCCDLEIEINNNFFVSRNGASFLLAHNSHLLTVPSRGDHIEVALMKLADINPDVRIVLLSATMPNVDEICGWICKLTGRDTYYLESDYRPCPLHIHYETYYDGERSYDANELSKVDSACAIVEDYDEDKFLVFVHTKRTGKLMLQQLERHGITAEFHNADLLLKDRLSLEDRFKNKGLRVIVATSTLAWGMNLPARRVIVTGVHRGLSAVENYDVWQMVGRAGRPRFDPVGDAYILVPESQKNEYITKLNKKSLIRSTLLQYVGKEDNPHYKTLAFHVVSEIHRGSIKTREGFREWFKNSLAHYQDIGFDDNVLESTIELLLRCKAIKIEDDEYHCTAIGTIASMFYFSPFDVSDLRRNFRFIFEKGVENDDFAAAMALGNIDTFRWGIVNRHEREQMAGFELKVKRMFGENSFTSSAIKLGYAYYNMLKGNKNVPAFQALQGALTVDLDRTMQVVSAIDGMAARWDKKGWIKTLRLRLRYGVGPELVELCQIPNVGQVRANRLRKQRIKNMDDFTSFDAGTLAKVMKCSKKLAEEALAGARMVQLQESIDV